MPFCIVLWLNGTLYHLIYLRPGLRDYPNFVKLMQCTFLSLADFKYMVSKWPLVQAQPLVSEIDYLSLRMHGPFKADVQLPHRSLLSRVTVE